MEPLSLSALLERALLLSRMCIFSEDIGVSTKNIYYLIFTHPLPSKGKKISCDFALQEKKIIMLSYFRQNYKIHAYIFKPTKTNKKKN